MSERRKRSSAMAGTTERTTRRAITCESEWDDGNWVFGVSVNFDGLN
jgi:hypothetical protein